MRLRNFKRKAIGLSLSATALAGVGIMSYAGDLPIHLADYTSSTSQVQLPAATDATANVPPGEIFGLCTAYLNHISGEATTSTTSPSSTTTTSASTTTTSSSSSTTPSTSGSSTTTSSTTASDQDNLKVPMVLTNAAKAKGETVLQLCAAVNPQHAKLKLFQAVKVDSDDTTTTTVAPTTTTTAASTTTTTSAASSSSLKDDSHADVSSSNRTGSADTHQKSSDQSVFGSDHSSSSNKGSIGLNLNTHFNAHVRVSGNQG